ncbi:MAG: glycosyltransferase family 2 protein [Bacteroidia bacterium]
MHELKFKRYSQSALNNYDLSVLIPSWNNLGHLKLCVSSIRTHSSLKVQIIVVVNEGSDGTLEWCKNAEDLDIVYFEQNAGICYGLNACRALIKSDWIVYMNDDMYVLPKWDTRLYHRALGFQSKAVALSGTLIEPEDTGNPCVVISDFGRDLETFNENELIASAEKLKKEDWSGSTWPPLMLHIDYWDLVGGMSIEFSPGMYSDPDLSMKLYTAGLRDFIGVGSSLVYHFGSKSTGRIRKNTGRKAFLLKWGISSREFYKNQLFMGESVRKASTHTTGFITRLKRAWFALRSRS